MVCAFATAAVSSSKTRRQGSIFIQIATGGKTYHHHILTALWLPLYVAHLLHDSCRKRAQVAAFTRSSHTPTDLLAVAERTFKHLRAIAEAHPSIRAVAISHSTEASTRKWVADAGGPGKIHVIVDPEREVYAKWGLGVSGWLHLANPAAFWSAYQLGKTEGIWNRPTESGSRWQTAGSYAVDGGGVVRWGGPAGRSDEVARFEDGVGALGGGELKL